MCACVDLYLVSKDKHKIAHVTRCNLSITMTITSNSNHPPFFSPLLSSCTHIPFPPPLLLPFSSPKGIVVGVPNPSPGDETIQDAIESALQEASILGIKGAKITPFVLAAVEKITKGTDQNNAEKLEKILLWNESDGSRCLWIRYYDDTQDR